ncbi:SUKH-4 family immunity protein [Streptomyces sp. NPDC050738]|uniref:SUKH-4 family immunity protein n=1 Tax=Streptomyces sp. NPDC050738 TaxID=3154744 RepID=UPI0034270EC2
MISQDQALATADQWLNPYGLQGPIAPRREVKMHEFDLGWVVWAAPAPMERDPETGERRPPAEIGNACGVVDRRSGELTVWPSVPVEEVVRMYQQKHGGGTAAVRPVTGPGNTAVFTYVDPANGEETSLFKTAAPGLPPVEYQAWAELRRMNVPEGNVVAIHTDLRPALLPGGYTAQVLNSFPNAQFSCTHEYGARPEERAQGISGLVQHAELMAQMAGQQAPPRPQSVPVPAQVAPAEPLRDVAVGRHLTEVFGADGVRRPDADDIAASRLPEDAKKTLTWAGLPADLPFFFTADRDDAPPAGGLFADGAAAALAAGTQADESDVRKLAHFVRIGTDGLYTVMVQVDPSRRTPDGVGSVWAIDLATVRTRWINSSVAAFDRSLALLASTRARMQGLDPVTAGAAVAAFQEQLAAIDAPALGDPETWWSVVVEQMWHGLF